MAILGGSLQRDGPARPHASCHDTVICVDSFPGGEGGPTAGGRATGRPATQPNHGKTKGGRPQPYAFWKAALLALLPLIPAIALAVWALARVGVGNPAAGLVEVLRLTVVFAGPAGLLTVGGIGRLAAEAGAARGRGHAAWVGARTLAVAGAGLALLAAIPLGELPTRWPGWVALCGAGAAIGAGTGALVGLAVGGPLPTLSDLGVPERLQVDPLRALRRAGQRARRVTRRAAGRVTGAVPREPRGQ